MFWNHCDQSGKSVRFLWSRYLDPFQNFQRVKRKYLSYCEINLGRWMVFLETGPLGPDFIRVTYVTWMEEREMKRLGRKMLWLWAEARAILLSRPARGRAVPCLGWAMTTPGGHQVSTSISYKRGYRLEWPVGVMESGLESHGGARHGHVTQILTYPISSKGW